MEREYNFSLYSSRFNHNDPYTIIIHDDGLDFISKQKVAKMKSNLNSDPEWDGVDIEDILRNVGIYPPNIIKNLLYQIWHETNNNAMSVESTEKEINALADYLNACTKAKPKTDFWKKIF